MTKRMVLGMMCCIVTTAAFAFLSNLGPSADDINRWSQFNRQETEAVKSGDWAAALDFHRKAMRTATGSDSSSGAAGRASDCLTTFFYLWNLEQYGSARGYLEECVRILQNSGYGTGSESRALVLLGKVKSGKVSESMKFTYTDIREKSGIMWYIMERPWAIQLNKLNEYNRRLDALNRSLDSQLKTAKSEGERIERSIKFQARQDFLEKHHETFDPNNRPSYNSPMREDWDACKRIYDIFD